MIEKCTRFCALFLQIYAAFSGNVPLRLAADRVLSVVCSFFKAAERAADESKWVQRVQRVQLGYSANFSLFLFIFDKIGDLGTGYSLLFGPHPQTREKESEKVSCTPVPKREIVYIIYIIYIILLYIFLLFLGTKSSVPSLYPLYPEANKKKPPLP